MKNRLLILVGVFIGLAAFIAAPSLAVDDSTITDFFRPNEIVVMLRPGADINSFNARYGTATLERQAGTNNYRLGLQAGETVEQKLNQVAGDPDLIEAQPNFEFQSPEIRQGSQAFVDQGSQAFVDGQSPANYYEQTSLAGLRIEQAHEISRGAGVKVAVIDTGLDFSHPLFAGRVAAPYYDFVSNDVLPADEPNGAGTGHGTFVAGLIMRAAPEARLMPLRAFASNGRGSSFDIARAIRYAVDNGAHVINMSFGLLDDDPLIASAVGYATARNVFLVASAGNENLERVHYPASAGEPLAVTATGANDLKAWFANYGLNVNVAAPGAGLHSAYPGGRWAFWDGTSFSTALVSGEAALLLAPNLLLNRQTLREKIVSSGVALDPLNPSYAGKLGNVRVDFRTALEHLSVLTAISVRDHKNNKIYQPGGSDGDEPLRDLKSRAEEFKCEVESGAGFWWQSEFADPAAGTGNPTGVFVNLQYRSETNWAGTLTAQYYNGSTLVAAIQLPVNSSEDKSAGKGRAGVFRWNLSSVVKTRTAVVAGRVRFINQSSNSKKVWVTYADLEAPVNTP